MNEFKKVLAITLLLASCMMLSISANGQNFVKLVNDDDIITKRAFSDSLLVNISFPHGISKLQNYPKINIAAIELMQLLEDPDIELVKVYVKGSASPEGLWGDNEKLSRARTNNIASYIQQALDLPEDKICKVNMVEDWDMLYNLVEVSDIPYKNEVLDIIKYLNWGERKRALMTLGGGKVWKILIKDFFPQLRYAKFGIYCRVKPQPQLLHKTDTVYVRDTIFIKETLPQRPIADEIEVETKVLQPEVEAKPAPSKVKKAKRKKDKSDKAPWHLGLNTNLFTDAILPNFGMEFQMGNHLSLKLVGSWAWYNIFVPNDTNAMIYGFRPQLRCWFGKQIMRQGSYIAIDGNLKWLTMQWRDGFLYQNGAEGAWNTDAGNHNPIWYAGLSYGYCLGFGKKKAWGLEFELGLGYGKYGQNVGKYNDFSKQWEYLEHQKKQIIGITHADITLTYRFAIK